MLCLKRNKGETIVVGDGLITIMVTQIGGTTATIGIQAPRDIKVIRGELCESTVSGGEVVTEQIRGETAEQREYRLAMQELKSKPPGQLRHAR